MASGLKQLGAHELPQVWYSWLAGHSTSHRPLPRHSTWTPCREHSRKYEAMELHIEPAVMSLFLVKQTSSLQASKYGVGSMMSLHSVSMM